MNIYDGYRFINFIANKAMSGKTMQPHEYNVNLDAASIDMFNKEWQKLRAYAVQNKLNVFQVIELGHALKPFISLFTLATIPTSGKVAVPPLFVDARAGRCLVGGLPKRIDFVSHEYLNNRLTNPLETSLLDMPAANIMGDYIQIYPKAATAVNIIYLRYPQKPYFGYTLDTATDLPTYLAVDEIRAKALITFSGSPSAGYASVIVTVATVAYTLGRYDFETGNTLLDVIHGLCANINKNTKSHGYTAEVTSATTMMIYAPIGTGPATGYVASVPSTPLTGATITVTTDFSVTLPVGIAGSKQLEWAPEYHMEIYKQILSNLGVNLSDANLLAYKKEFEVQGV